MSPNPFNSSADTKYTLHKEAITSIDIYNLNR